MNRRQFTASLGALAAVPALPMKALASTSAAGSIPNASRFWAIYMSHLHGSCSAPILAKASGVSVNAAHSYLKTMIADGVITPTRIAAQTTGAKLAQTEKPTGMNKRFKKFLNSIKDDAKQGNQDTEIDETAEGSEPS